MKKIMLLALISSLSISLISFNVIEKETLATDLSGKWELQIDSKIDGNISGNNGCDLMSFTAQGNDRFQGKYASCPGSNNAKSSLFSAKVYETNRGTLITILQDNKKGTQYYASWSGRLVEPGFIIGIWTDVEGNQGDFQLTK